VLIDAGLHGSAERIVHAAEELFGQGSRPAAIVLTHGHFDHVGALRDLALLWDVPIYAHELELPYLDGRSAYPPPDPTVGGGVMAALSRLYPRGPIDVRDWLRTLPADGAVPGMAGWRWIHTPGHTPGSQCFHVAERLVSGDTLFLEGCGRTDLPGSNVADMYDSLQTLAAMPSDTIVYPGHRYSQPFSATLESIRETNYVFRPSSPEQWLQMFGR
jgi:glyoxylase-like metal-dependent hydrolase (beta-lactamase superfamily II)